MTNPVHLMPAAAEKSVLTMRPKVDCWPVLSERVLMLFGEGQQVTDPDVVLRDVMWDLRSVGPSIITIPQKLETTF